MHPSTFRPLVEPPSCYVQLRWVSKPDDSPHPRGLPPTPKQRVRGDYQPLRGRKLSYPSPISDRSYLAENKRFPDRSALLPQRIPTTAGRISHTIDQSRQQVKVHPKTAEKTDHSAIFSPLFRKHNTTVIWTGSWLTVDYLRACEISSRTTRTAAESKRSQPCSYCFHLDEAILSAELFPPRTFREKSSDARFTHNPARRQSDYIISAEVPTEQSWRFPLQSLWLALIALR